MQTEAERYQFAVMLATRAAEFEAGIPAAAPPTAPIRIKVTAGGETTDITFQTGNG